MEPEWEIRQPELVSYGEDILLDRNDNMTIICAKHKLVVDEKFDYSDLYDPKPTKNLECPEGPHTIVLDRTPREVKEYIRRKIESKKYQEAKYFDIDGYLIPASKEAKVKTKSGEYFVTTQVMNSEKKGEQIVIYAGKKGTKGKAQIFIDPTHGKITFDQNDINPKDIFVKIEATFRDGSKASIKAADNRDVKQ
jgi:hypothetical protein